MPQRAYRSKSKQIVVVNKMSPENLDEAQLLAMEERAQAARPPPWRSFVEGRDHQSGSSFIMVGAGIARSDDIELSGATVADQDFIAHAREDVPALIAEVRRLRRLHGS
jgi:hypothetical protein